MKNSNFEKIVLFGLLILVIYSAFLAPITTAQEWIYTGVDTEKIPDHNVYPSEWFVLNTTADDLHYIHEITHGNVTDHGSGNTTSVWGNVYSQNKTTKELEFLDSFLLSSWNSSIGYKGGLSIIPVESNGLVSQSILDSVKDSYPVSGDFDYSQAYLNPCSVAFWNDDGSYLHINYTTDGEMSAYTGYLPSNPLLPNISLVSSPARLSPDFGFTTDNGVLIVHSTSIKLDVSITEADNNNNQVIDTDYQYRVLNGSNWTNWTTLSGFIDYDLSSESYGAYQITLEVKNMYGSTQEQITIQYTAPPGDGAIPGYSMLIIAMVLLLGVSLTLVKHKMKSKYL